MGKSGVRLLITPDAFPRCVPWRDCRRSQYRGRGSVKPPAQPTLVRTQHLPPPAKTARELGFQGLRPSCCYRTVCHQGPPWSTAMQWLRTSSGRDQCRGSGSVNRYLSRGRGARRPGPGLPACRDNRMPSPAGPNFWRLRRPRTVAHLSATPCTGAVKMWRRRLLTVQIYQRRFAGVSMAIGAARGRRSRAASTPSPSRGRGVTAGQRADSRRNLRQIAEVHVQPMVAAM